MLQLVAAMQQQVLAPNVMTYNALINACEKGKHPELALRLVEARRQQMLALNVITYNALISVCEEGRQT